MAFKPTVLSLHLFFISSISFSQVLWTRADSLFGELPASIKVFYTNDSLDGKPFKAYYIEALLKDKKLEFTTQSGYGKRNTPSIYYAQEKNPYVVVNGTFFSFQNNQNLNLLIRKKKLLAYNVTSLKGKGVDSLQYYYPTRSALGISKKRRADVAWTFTDSNKSWVYAFPGFTRGGEREK